MGIKQHPIKMLGELKKLRCTGDSLRCATVRIKTQGLVVGIQPVP